MTLTVADLIVPKGEIAADLFGADTESYVTTWLGRAETAAADVDDALMDAATAAYAYHLAFTAKARQLASLPQSYSEDGATMQHSVTQAAFFQRLADGRLGEFNGYLASSEDVTPPQSRPVSSSVRSVVVF